MKTERSAAGLQLIIDLGALASNWRRLRDESAPAECAAVIKADAYGLGVEAAAPALRAAGCRTFFVALPEEGRRARAAVPDATIYVLNGFFTEAAEIYREAALRPVLNSLADIGGWAAAGGGPSALQVDTGMNRLGLSLAETLALARDRPRREAAGIELLISHLACADLPGHPLTGTQLALFREICAEFPGLKASLAHSAGIFRSADFLFDLVRPGIALYGGRFMEDRDPLAPVVTARARILQLREADAGETVGYGAAHRLARDTRLAIVAAGYADGYRRVTGPRHAEGAPRAFLRGRLVPLLGRVSMDLIALDVTGLPGVTEGDWVELFGPHLPVDDVAAAAGTIGYELLAGLSRRAERIYLRGPETA